MKTFLLASLVSLACAIAAASTPMPKENSEKPSLELEVQEDVARWKALPLVQPVYQPPPQGWHLIEIEDLRISYSSPCKPERTKVAEHRQAAIHYACAVEGRSYSLYAFPARDLHVSENRDIFFWAHAKGLLRGTSKLGATGSLQPKNRVFYQGAIGRQSILNLGGAQIEMRMLPGSNAMISMQVTDLPGKQPGDSERYFNSLKIF
jgi:hypothetical protein